MQEEHTACEAGVCTSECHVMVLKDFFCVCVCVGGGGGGGGGGEKYMCNHVY